MVGVAHAQYYGGYPSDQAAGGYGAPGPGVQTVGQNINNQTVYQNNIYNQSAYQTTTENYAYASQYPSNYNVRAKKKKYYGVLRIGYGETRGFGSPFLTPRAPMFSGAIGMYFENHTRADLELSYHWKDKLYHKTQDGESINLDYYQYDFGINGYYDIYLKNFPAKLRPFMGAGVWISNSKVSGAGKKTDRSVRNFDSEMNLAASVALGLAYDLDESLTLEGMFRARYIFCDSHLYNLETLFGVRYHF